MKRWLPGLLCLWLSAPLLAAGAHAVRQNAVGSMLVTGWIEVAPTGRVEHFDLDQSSKLPPAVAKLINQAIPGWMFERVEIAGKPVQAKSRMSLRIVADPVGNGNYRIKIAGAQFAAPEGNGKIITDDISEKRAPGPAYPRAAEDYGVSGTVYVLFMVDHHGDVAHALAQQVDLKVVAGEGQMESFRRLLAEAATKAVKHWTFNTPTTGPKATKPYWLGRVPVTFLLYRQKPVAYGQWDIYIPGPVETAQWIHQLPSIGNDKLIIANVDSTPSGGNFSLTNGLHLISKLSGS